MALELIKCPFCKFKFRMDVEELVKEGEAPISRALFDFLKKKPEKSMKIDIKCPKCGKNFLHEV
ncbi:hypothetical protein [Methanosarcina sp. KYL-1]|uniref:hypothetical protein n=1 Tax=Methanosarcina sp. KYL-1 TaxID=2602068 RepID=UPI0021014D4F|nr:hypothetical protein [Methanosarcina sp. KYL-1]